MIFILSIFVIGGICSGIFTYMWCRKELNHWIALKRVEEDAATVLFTRSIDQMEQIRNLKEEIERLQK